jgi:hypothetical protein
VTHAKCRAGGGGEGGAERDVGGAAGHVHGAAAVGDGAPPGADTPRRLRAPGGRCGPGDSRDYVPRRLRPARS